MARFDAYRHPSVPAGYLLQVQSDVIDELDTRVVVPLMPPADVPRPTCDLHPVFRVQGEDMLMATQLLGAIARRELREPVAHLAHERDSITRALGLLLTGF